jgi:hypothetical protein
MRGIALLFGALLLAGCPGEANMPPKDGGGDPSWMPLPDMGGWQLPDGPVPDGVFPATEAGLVDGAGGPDQALSTTVGGPCPCAAPLYCVGGSCRQQCTVQPCNGLGNCNVGEACVNTKVNIPVCVPAAAKGQPCNNSTPCAGGNLCLTTDPNSQNGKCFATCTSAGSNCAGGGTCYTITGSNCLFCYP